MKDTIRLIDYFATHAMVAVVIEKDTSYRSWSEVASKAYDLAFEMIKESKLRDDDGRSTCTLTT